jgi:hypothetical protein
VAPRWDMDRTTWTDERLDERMAAIDDTSERIFTELAGIREDMRSFRIEFKSEIGELRAEVRSEIRDLRADVNHLGGRQDRFQDRMVQVGFALLGVTIASIAAIFIALISAGG